MGAHQYNFSILCDYATPEKHAALELHMELAVPYQDIGQIQSWLSTKNWKSCEDYLVSKYPRHGELISHWMRASQTRSEGKQDRVRWAA